MNLQKVAAALRLLADALEDTVEAMAEREAIQNEPPIPEPVQALTVELVRDALNGASRAHSRKVVAEAVGQVNLATADQNELVRIMAALRGLS